MQHSTAVHIEGGKLVLEDRAGFAHEVRRMKDGPYVLTLSTPERKKTRDQLAYWWGHAVPLIAEHCGYTDTQMHYALLGECFGFSDGPCGKPIPNVPSIADCTVEQVTTLIDWVLTWAPTELGVMLQEPDKLWKKTRGRHAAA